MSRVAQGTTLVDQAGTTMQEVVTSNKRVTDIMGEISTASNEQSQGVSQVGEAVTQMDQATQQNAALVEEMAAAAGSRRLVVISDPIRNPVRSEVMDTPGSWSGAGASWPGMTTGDAMTNL